MFILKPTTTSQHSSYSIVLGDYTLQTDYEKIYSHTTNKKIAILIFENRFEFKAKFIDINNYESIKNIARLKSIPFTEIVYEKNIINIIPDPTYRIEVYYHKLATGVIISNSILEISKSIELTRSVFGIIYGLTSNNSKPPKKHTLFNELKKIGFNEFIKLSKEKFQIIRISEKLLKINYRLSSFDVEKKYREVITSATERRMSNSENTLMLSSGWDSTGLLALMRELKPRSAINCVFLKIKSKKNGELFNEYEFLKSKKFAKYYGVDLNIIEIDYTGESIYKFFKSNTSFFKNSCCFTLPALNHLKIFSKLDKFCSKSAPVFCGEMSDAVHSLGFGQNISIFHDNSYGFRHYSDKMMSYIFSPSFIRWIEENNYSDELVWNIIRSSKAYESTLIKKPLQKEDLLFSLFLAKERFPFIKRANPFNIKKLYLDNFRSECFSNYFSESIKKLSDKNVYSIFMQLYENFHWQGGTVMSIDEAARFYGYHVTYPFHDRDFINFMSTVPEKFGRGLELLPTKYLWKNFLEKNLKYPSDFHIGPHSYQYDTNPGADFHAQVHETNFGMSIIKKAKENFKLLIDNHSDIFIDAKINPKLTNSEIMKLSFQYAVL